jgi:Na+-transporting methylmalonyl-CoA/oxaloacetate decarboxylase gamma subunit
VKDLAFGLTMTVMGMGVTLITLYLLTLLIRLLIRLFPMKEEEEGKG